MELQLHTNFCFQFTHEGLTLSCGVGPTHYCRNQREDLLDHINMCKDYGSDPVGWIKKMPPKTDNMEVAIWHPLVIDGKIYHPNHPDNPVTGWVPLSKLGGLLQAMLIPGPPEERLDLLDHMLNQEMEDPR